jgi:hypothetical protein
MAHKRYATGLLLFGWILPAVLLASPTIQT